MIKSHPAVGVVSNSTLGRVRDQAPPSPLACLNEGRTTLRGSVEVIVIPYRELSYDEGLVRVERVRHVSPTSPVFFLDGALRSQPFIDETLGIANFDHHLGVNRLTHPSTVSQVTTFLESDVWHRIRSNFPERPIVFVNDPDLDTTIPLCLLDRAYRTPTWKLSRTLKEELVPAIDLPDRCCGMFDLRQLKSPKILGVYAWLNEPFVTWLKLQGCHRSTQGMIDIIHATQERFERFIEGRGEERALDQSCVVEPGGRGWSIVRWAEFCARGALARQEGVDAFLFVDPIGRDRLKCTLAKRTPRSDFPLKAVRERLNYLEQQRRDGVPLTSEWGPPVVEGSLFVASPRDGSVLSSHQIQLAINGVLKSNPCVSLSARLSS